MIACRQTQKEWIIQDINAQQLLSESWLVYPGGIVPLSVNNEVSAALGHCKCGLFCTLDLSHAAKVD